MAPDEIRYDSIKEAREWYYVEYSPPMGKAAFSILSLTIEDVNADREKIAQAMEREASVWVSRFPVPVMVSAFTMENDLVCMDDIRPWNHVIAWSTDSSSHSEWRLVPDDELPTVALNEAYLRRFFSHLPHRTGAQVSAEVRKQHKHMKAGWWLVFVWAVVVPVGIAVLEWWSDLLGVVVLVFAFIKAGHKALRLTGKLPKSEREKEKEAQELRMRHHHYHCERNPEAFTRLKAENFRKEATDRSRVEAEKLRGQEKAAQTPQQGNL
jgi:hypothetical protein